MTIIVEEKEGCIIYCEGSSPLVIDTPMYKDTASYKEWVGNAKQPCDGTLAEGLVDMHLYIKGTTFSIPKAKLLYEASLLIYNYGAEMAPTDGYKPFDQSDSGVQGKKHLINTIFLIISQIKRREAIIRIPYLMPFDNSQIHDIYPDYYIVPNFDFGNFSDSIRHTLPENWVYSTALTYSFIFSQYFQNK